jgi:hypothetical protein
MKRAPLTLLVFVVIAPTFGKPPTPTVTFVSPCECTAFHGINRWVAKTDLSPVLSDKSAIQAITPSQIYAWKGLPPDVDITDYFLIEILGATAKSSTPLCSVHIKKSHGSLQRSGQRVSINYSSS